MKKTSKFTDEETYDIVMSEVLGQQAFVNGLMAAPAIDAEVMKLVKKYSTPDLSKSDVIISIFKQWARGWHTANMVGDLQ